jgi:hypothetical protein
MVGFGCWIEVWGVVQVKPGLGYDGRNKRSILSEYFAHLFI